MKHDVEYINARNDERPELLSDERGAGMVEYIILAGVVALLSVAAFSDFGQAVQNKIGEHGSAVGAIPSN